MAGAPCLTEVLLPALPFVDRHTRLHRYLPPSPYTHGAIYISVDAPVKVQDPSDRVTDGNHTYTASSNILLLAGEFNFRFGGRQEQHASPPWSWTHEELCGKPHPYYARDLHRFDSTARLAKHPQRLSTITLILALLAILGPELLAPAQFANHVSPDSAAYIMRLSFCSTAVVDYLQTTQIPKLPGWLSESYYECHEQDRMPYLPGALRYVCIHCFDTTFARERVAALVDESFRLMRIHRPDLQCYIGTYQLEGSVAHQKASEHGEGPLDSWYSKATTRENLSPTSSLATRQSSTLHSPPPPPPRQLVPIVSLLSLPDRQASDRRQETYDSDSSQSPRKKILKSSSNQRSEEQTRNGHPPSGVRFSLQPEGESDKTQREQSIETASPTATKTEASS